MKHTDYNVFNFAQNTKGLNTRDTLAKQDPNSASDLQNVDFNSRGAIRERRGYTRLTNSPLSEQVFLGLANYKVSTGGQDAVAVVDDKIYKMDDLDGEWDDITGAVSLTAGNYNYASMTIGLDTLIGTNGIDAPWKYTQSGNVAALSVSEFTISKYIKFWKNRLIHFATTESGDLQPTRMRWSNPDTIETYESAHYLNIENKDGSVITGVGNLFDSLYVFKDSYTNGIAQIVYTGDTEITFTYNTFNEVGATSNGSIVKVNIPNIGNVLLYWGIDNKIRAFDGTTSVPISDHIQPTLDSLNTSNNRYIQAVNFYSLNQVWFFVSEGSSLTHNKVIVYDYLNNAFLVHTGIACNIGEVLFNSNNDPFLVTGGYNGLSYIQNTGNNDDGAAIHSIYKSAWMDFGESISSKRVRWAMLYLADLGDYSLNVKWSFNFSDAAFSSLDVNMASSDPVFPFTFPITLGGESVIIRQIGLNTSNDAKYFRIEFSNSNANEPWTLYRYDLFVKTTGIRD